MKGLFSTEKGEIKEIELPKGYRLKFHNDRPDGLPYFDKELGRYWWRPQKGCLFFDPYNSGKIYEYLEWNRQPERTKGFFMTMDGYGKVRELGKKRGFWINNIKVRECIPIEIERK